MKKLLTAALLIFSLSTHAQEFEKGTNVISAGIGLGSAIGNFNYSSQAPGLSLQYEHGIWPMDGPGVISLGGYLGFKSYKYEIPDYRYKWNYTIVGVRSAYHYTGHGVENLDIYGGVMLSYNFVHYTYRYSGIYGPIVSGNIKTNYNNTVGFSIYVGGRYYVAENIAGFLELGYGVSYANLGIAFRF